MNLGRPGGVELLRVMHQRNVRVKILAATAPGQSELKAAASALGVREFYELPFAPAELNERIRLAIGR
jgi:DNA-binding response OmpR family regulator